MIGCQAFSRATRNTSPSRASRRARSTPLKCARSADRLVNPIGATRAPHGEVVRSRTAGCNLPPTRRPPTAISTAKELAFLGCCASQGHALRRILTFSRTSPPKFRRRLVNMFIESLQTLGKTHVFSKSSARADRCSLHDLPWQRPRRGFSIQRSARLGKSCFGRASQSQGGDSRNKNISGGRS